jgi:AraC-like DNA-binding protein
VFEFNRLSSLLLIFFVHGIVYASLALARSVRNGTRSDRWLALFLLLGTLYITPWMVGFAGWYDNQPYRDFLFYFPFQQLFFIGPVTYFYVQSLLNPGFLCKRPQLLHLVPGFLYLTFCLAMVITDKVILKDYYFLENGQDPDFDSWYQLAGMLSMLVYFLLSLRYYNMYRSLMLQVTSYADRITFQWVKRFLLAFLLMLVVRLSFLVASIFVDFDYWSNWWQFFLFALILYYVAVSGYSNNTALKIFFRPALLPHHPVILLNPSTSDEVPLLLEQEMPVPAVQDEALLEFSRQILETVRTKKLYEDPELSLAQLAAKLGSNAGIVSKTINQGFELNFNDFINRFRVEAVQEAILAGKYREQTILGLAFDAGFNSKATFNRAFKKFTGKNPKDLISEVTAETE